MAKDKPDVKDETPPAPPPATSSESEKEVVFVQTGDAHARAEIARQVAEQKATGKALDKAQPGGFYIGRDGKAHDAEGRPLNADGSKVVRED